MNILLIIVGILFLISILVGYKKGFLKIALSLGVTIAAIVLVTMLTPYVSGWIQSSTPLGGSVEKKIEEIFQISTGTSEDRETTIESSREQQISIIEEASLPKALQEMLLANNNHEVYEALGVTSFVGYVGAYITKLLSDIIAFLVLLLVAMIAVRVIMKMAGIVDKIPVIGGVNKIAGGVVGAGVALIIVWLMFLVITLLYSTSLGEACMANIAESQILTTLYDSNYLMKFITKF